MSESAAGPQVGPPDRIIRRLRQAMQLALVLLVLEILAWLFSIAGSSP
ncbi:MAG TPA: hypothetical protein VE915_03535 [Actinomycetota bacterium]|nr:hypothetical protein [Actinomycetota bacterium]